MVTEREKKESKVHVLVVGEEPFLDDELTTSSPGRDYTLHSCRTQEEALSYLRKNTVQILILESKREIGEQSFVRKIKTDDPLINVIIIGDPAPAEEVMEWINLGASDYLLKPLQAETMHLLLRRFEEKRSLKREIHFLEKKLEKKYIFQEMVGKSPFMLEIFSLIESCAKYFSTVLITGETGTGKEMVAKALHNLCPTKNRRVVVCDCTSVPENLFESELFGYVKGAFTGADRDKKGLFEEAQEGIIFLDEIGEMPFSFQAKLLRVLESHEIRPVGSNMTREVKVRVIAATNKDLSDEVKKGNFREDLFHRVNKVEINLPPLKKRAEDIPLLVRFLLDKYNRKFNKRVRGVSRDTQKFFLSYEWPGNVRELENVVERASMLCKREFIDIIDLPKYLQKMASSSKERNFFQREDINSLKELEKEYIAYLLQRNNHNIRKTARILDISRTTLYHKLNKYTILIPPS